MQPPSMPRSGSAVSMRESSPPISGRGRPRPIRWPATNRRASTRWSRSIPMETPICGASSTNASGDPMPDLLIELFSEEIPARMQARAAEDLRRLVTGGMVDRGLTYSHAAAFATPRRLTLAVEGLASGTPATREERRGPRVDAPDKAVEGFLRSTGVSRESLKIREDRNGAVFLAVIERPGRGAAEIVAEVLTETVRDFPWPKSMRWGSGSLRWVRPLHSIVCVLSDDSGTEVVPVEIDGIVAGDVTRGHRFMAPEPFAVS